jgi:hypothetical protein
MNLAIDPDILERAVKVSGERTKKAAVTKALQEFIARREQRDTVLKAAAGLWKDRDDLPDFDAIRSEWDRTA